MNYKVITLGPVSEYDGKFGRMKKYSLQLEDVEGWVELSQKPETAPPSLGQELDGTIEETQWGKKLKKAQQAPGGFQGRSNENPATRQSIERQASVYAAVTAVRDYYGMQTQQPQFLLKDYVEKIMSTATAFERHVTTGEPPKKDVVLDDLPPDLGLSEPF